MGWGPESTRLVNGRKWVGSKTGRDVYTPTDWAAGAEPKVGGLGKWHPLEREGERERGYNKGFWRLIKDQIFSNLTDCESCITCG